MNDFDVVIIGAGIGGASLAYALLQQAPGLKLALLEAEAQPGYHTTGRSAAFYAQTYGGPMVQPLTSSSYGFLTRPPADFSEHGFLLPRGALYVCNQADAQSVAAWRQLLADFIAEGLRHKHLEAAALQARAPFLRAEWRAEAIWDPDCDDIDVAALHQAYLRAMARMGGQLCCDARVTAIARNRDVWQVTTAAGTQFTASRIVDAAGAWADEVATMAGVQPIGIAPMRRTMVVADTSPAPAVDQPIIMDAGGTLYLKPDAGMLWISPHDETPDVPHDVQPEELDIAITIDRFETMCDWPLRRVVRSWAGLRSFAPDRLPVLGPDRDVPGFYWCAGQGGWGIQTAPAAAAVAAAAILQQPLPLAFVGIDVAAYGPGRLRQS